MIRILISLLLISSTGMSQNGEMNIGHIIRTPYTNYIADSLIQKQIHFNSGGIVWTPKGYSNMRTGTKDSEKGELKSESLLIRYDIGFSAGTQMGKHRTKECSSYFDTSINGHRVWAGLIKDSVDKKLVVTITDYNNRNEFGFPVNFWAIVKDELDIREVLKIIFSYKLN